MHPHTVARPTPAQPLWSMSTEDDFPTQIVPSGMPRPAAPPPPAPAPPISPDDFPTEFGNTPLEKRIPPPPAPPGPAHK